MERSIELAPAWVRRLVSPPAEVVRMRATVSRFLAGDRTAPVGYWAELEARWAAEDRRAEAV